MTQHLTDTITATADSLPATASGHLPEWSMASAGELFGPLSSLADPAAGEHPIHALAPAISQSTPYSSAILACFISACMILYIYRDYVFGIFNILRGSIVTEKILDEQSKVFNTFLGWTLALGLLMAGLLCLKYVEMWPVGDGETRGFEGLAITAAWGLVSLVWGYQYAFLRVAGYLTMSREFTDKLFYFRKITKAMTTIALLPLFLCFALTSGTAAEALGIAVAAVWAMSVIFLIIRTFMLFIRQNFSILLWILYLCAVEIFPISLVIIVAGKVLW